MFAEHDTSLLSNHGLNMSAIVSQDTRPAKRARFGSRSTVSKRRLGKTSALRRTWPNNKGWTRYYDPFPTMQKAIMRYVTDVSLDAGAGTVAHHLFNASSIFDPDVSGIGHQPYGHDQYQSIYNHYRVDKCIITASSGSGGSNNIFGIGLQPDTTLIASSDQARERKGVTFAPVANSTNSNKLQMTWNTKSTFPTDTSDSYSASFGANPAESVYFDVFTCGNLPSNDPSALAVTVTLTYYVTMWEPKILIGS